MKKLILFLLLSITAVISLSAQTKSQVLVDIRRTMEDFMADLSMVNMDRINIEYNVSFIANTFGHTEYFIHNGKEVESFQKWLEKYCMILIDGEPIQHSFTILEQSLSKVNPSQEADKRYKVDAIIRRERMYQGRQTTLPEDTLTFTFIWKGNQQYASIAEMDGQIKPLPVLENNDKLYNKACDYLANDSTEKALEILQTLAVKNYMKAINKIAEIYYWGIGISKDEKNAVEWWMIAAKQNDAEAQYNLGYAYLDGLGVEKDIRKALDYWLKAIAQVEYKLENNIGSCYYLLNDYDNAFIWYERAAMKDNPTGQFGLAQCYEKGLGTKQDSLKAFEWYKKAAENGNTESKYRTAMNYYHARGTEQNYGKAVEWLLSAALKNHTYAQSWLAYCYENGYGIEMDIQKAVEWYTKAANKGNDFAREAVERLKNHSTATTKESLKEEKTESNYITFSQAVKNIYTGRVMYEDKKGVKPMVGAKVSIKGSRTKPVLTNDFGYFKLENIKNGDIIRIQYKGYDTYQYKYKGEYEEYIFKPKL